MSRLPSKTQTLSLKVDDKKPKIEAINIRKGRKIMVKIIQATSDGDNGKIVIVFMYIAVSGFMTTYSIYNIYHDL